jgi:hypothetical protein
MATADRTPFKNALALACAKAQENIDKLTLADSDLEILKTVASDGIGVRQAAMAYINEILKSQGKLG